MPFNTQRFKSWNYRSLATELDEVVNWLKSFGLKIDPTRIGAYGSHLNQVADATDKGTVEELLNAQGSSKLINTLSEANELVGIYQGLKSCSYPDLQHQLQKLAKGPVFHNDERSDTSSNLARNTVFELALGALLRVAGFQVDPSPTGDLGFLYNDHEFFIEGKRPQVPHQINSRVRDALRQLEQRYQNSANPERARGLIAISATKILTPVSGYFLADTESTFITELRNTVQDFNNTHGKKWRNPNSKQTLGCIIEFSPFTFLKSDNRIIPGKEITLVERQDISYSDHQLLESVATKVQEGIRPC